MNMSLIEGSAEIHESDVNVDLKLHFSSSFCPKQDDVILLLPVGWSKLDQDQARPVLYPNGSRTVTFSTSELVERYQSDFTFQFVYFQDEAAVGCSSSFCLRESGSPVRWEFLRTTATEDTSRALSTTQTAQVAIDIVQTTVKSQATNAKLCELKKHDHDQEEAARLTSSLLDDQQADSREIRSETDSFVRVTIPGDQEFTSYEKELQTQLTESLSDRNRLSKLYEREKAIRENQEERNMKLQGEHDKALSENKQLKKELQHVESEVERVRLKVQTQNQHSGIPHLRSCTDEGGAKQRLDEEKSSGNHTIATSDEASCSDGSTDDRPITDMEASNAIASFTNVFTCPICLEKFDERDGSTQFQLHVHGHFSDEK